MNGSVAGDPRWRAYALDGAVVFFHRATGTHLHVGAPFTAGLRRRIPRAVMFGITNRCNLACTFCSRDLEAKSAWTPDSAFDILAELSARGVLEVAFGGGEPLAFRGFDALIERLSTETTLVPSFTTNGILLDRERVARLRDHVGEIRLSIYDDNPWAERAALLAELGVRFGANVLVTPARLHLFPALLERLASLGCKDVAVLSYVGDDPALHLDRGGDRALAAMIARAPLPARVSVCFGERLAPLPLLFHGDCGAGEDFVVLTSDKKMKACSFPAEGIAIETADDVLAAWNRQRDVLRAPIALGGCARRYSAPAAEPEVSGARVWRAFSGNNSGDCVLVGRFEEVSKAREFIAELMPGFDPGNELSQAWKELFARENIPLEEFHPAPDFLGVIGRSVLVHTHSAIDDDFPEVRTLLWKRGGRALYNGIHVHEDVHLLAGLAFPSSGALEQVAVELARSGGRVTARRGLQLFTSRKVDWDEGSLGVQHRELEQAATRGGAILSGELVAKTTPALDLPELLAAKPPAGKGEELERLFVELPDAETANRAVAGLEGRVQTAGKLAILESREIGANIGALMHQHGGMAHVVRGDVVRLELAFWKEYGTKGLLSLAKLEAIIRSALTPGDHLSLEVEPRSLSINGHVLTRDPCAVLSSIERAAVEQGATYGLDLQPLDPPADAVARISEDLEG